MPHPARRFLDAVVLPTNRGDAFSRLESAAQNAATSAFSRDQPTLAQRAASEYRMGHAILHGMPVRIENPRNTYREKADKGGKVWRSRMAAHYGDLPGTRGHDGDPVDVFIGPFPESTAVWVINQRHAGTDTLDEHKVMLGFVTEAQARAAYLDSYDRNWTGLMSMVQATVAQFKWWLKSGDMGRPFSVDQLPLEGKIIMDKVLWNQQAEPVTTNLTRLMYDLRVHDAKDGLMLDAATMAELMADPDLQSVPTYDALVVEVSRMSVKMDQLKAVMAAAGDAVKPTDVTISDPVKARGVLQVMVLFQMSDGQTIAIWFHNPDTTPAKLTPMDDLISWKWMLNKKDVTIVVAPERGQELNVREVARRVMRLVERNSEAYQKANAKAGERAAESKALDDEIVVLEVELKDVTRQIELAQVDKQAKADAVTRQVRDLFDKQNAAFERLGKEKAFGAAADVAKLELLMNEYDDFSSQIAVLKGEADAGRTSWAKWKALREAQDLRDNPTLAADPLATGKLRMETDPEFKKLTRDFTNSLAMVKSIDEGQNQGYDRALFVNSVAGKIKTRAKSDAQMAGLLLAWVDAVQSKFKKPAITGRNAIWALTEWEQYKPLFAPVDVEPAPVDAAAASFMAFHLDSALGKFTVIVKKEAGDTPKTARDNAWRAVELSLGKGANRLKDTEGIPLATLPADAFPAKLGVDWAWLMRGYLAQAIVDAKPDLLEAQWSLNAHPDVAAAAIAKASEVAPEPIPEPAPPAVDPALRADAAFFASVIAGTHPDMLEPELATKIEEAYLRNPDDPTTIELFSQAIDAYGDAMLKATEGM